MSSIDYQDIPLDQVVSTSAHIVQAEFKVGKQAYYGYKVKSILKGGGLKPGDNIRVVSKGTKRLKTMKEGKSPIFESYPLKNVDGDPVKTKTVILFLDEKETDGTYEFSVWPGYTGVTEIPAIQALLSENPK